MGYICLKNTFLQLKHYIQLIYLTSLSATCVEVYQITYGIFETINFFSRHKFSFYNFAFCRSTIPQKQFIKTIQTLHTFYKSIPNSLWFEKLHEEFGKFSLEHLQMLKLILSWDLFIEIRKFRS